MFGGDPFDPFGMRRQMNDIDRMMAEPFGMMNHMNSLMNQMLSSPFGPTHHPMLGLANPRQAAPPSRLNPHMGVMDVFGGFGGFGGGVMNVMDRAMDDPNSMVFSQSTIITMNPDGTQRVVSNSTRKAGDIKETRHALRDGDNERVSVGHHIGDRTHYIEKKRDRDGQYRQRQKFVNMNQDDVKKFDTEFKSRARRNLGALFGSGVDNDRSRRAIEAGPGRRGATNPSPSTSSEPIVTEPDNEEDDDIQVTHVSHGSRSGPIIREIDDDEPSAPKQSSSGKRRRGMFGEYFRD